MIQQYAYQDDELPDSLRCQILSFIRITWLDGFEGKNRWRDWIAHKEHHPVHFVLVEKNNLLVSYVGVVWKYLKHAGKTYKMYGFSGVFTYPQFRNHKHGLDLVKKAKKYIEQTDGDLVLFSSTLHGFYEKAGFEHMEKVTLLEGNRRHPQKHGENTYMLFLSDKGKSHRHDFETKPVYFGEAVW